MNKGNFANNTIYTPVGDKSAFWYSPEAELIHAAEGVLRGTSNNLYNAIYGSERLESYRLKYRLAGEFCKSVSERGGFISLFELLHGFNTREFTFSAFRNYVLAIDETVLPGRLLDTQDATPDEIMKIDVFNSYLDAVAFVKYAKEYANEILEMAEEMKCDAFYDVINDYSDKISSAMQEVKQALSSMTPLEYSDRLMRKTMYRRGPYSFFTFSPSVFSHSTMRFMKDEQFLFFSIRDTAFDNERIISQLKALADDTRFRIIMLLKERGFGQASDIITEIGLSAPTISHHMKVLRETGLVVEQTDGNTKVYSLPTDIAGLLTKALGRLFE